MYPSKRLNPRVCAVALCALFPQVLYGQNEAGDSTFVDRSVSLAISMYDETVRNQLMLYNGEEYNPYPEPYDDYPYFGSEYWEEGSVFYYGEWYHDVSMQYDIFKDELVIEHYGQSGYMAQVKLHSDKVDSFVLLGHTFIRIEGDSLDNQGLRPGFYDLLYNGDTRIICRRRKSVIKNIELATLTISFSEKDSYFLIKNGTAFPVRNKSTVLKVLKDKKKILNQSARKGKLDFVHNKENAIIQMVRYYDELKDKSSKQ